MVLQLIMWDSHEIYFSTSPLSAKKERCFVNGTFPNPQAILQVANAKIFILFFFFFMCFWQRSELRTVYNIQDEITLSSPQEIREQLQSHTKLIADVAANSKNLESLEEMKTLMDSQTFLVYLFIFIFVTLTCFTSSNKV